MYETLIQVRIEPTDISKGIENYGKRITDELKVFKEANRILHVLGILGGAEGIPEETAIQILNDCLSGLKNSGIAVLTGGSKGGIPEIGQAIAKEYGIPTIGVYPPNAAKYGLSPYMDLGIMTPPPALGSPSFGSESYTLINCLDAAIIVGGSYGTLIEVGTALKRNKSNIEDGLPPIYICPISGTGGVADKVRTIAGNNSFTDKYLPAYDIYDGATAVRFLTSVL